MSPRDQDLMERYIYAVTRRLPRAQREVLELRYGQGLRVGEVARALGVSRFAAARTISAALEALREHLGPAWGAERGAKR